MKKSLLITSLLSIALAQTACTDKGRAEFSAYNSPHRITLYSAGGQIIKQWHTNGKVQNAGGSDGYEFVDATTGKLVRVSGTVVVEVL